MLSDEVCSVVTGTGTLSGRLHVVELSDDLAETRVEQVISGHPRVMLVVEVSPLDLVLECLLELLTTEDHLHLPLLAGLTGDLDLHLCLVLVGECTGGLFQHLSVVAILVTPLNVRDWGLFEMLIQMVEGVLRDVTNTKGWVLVDFAFLGEGLSGEELDEGRFTGTIGAEDTDTTAESESTGDVLEGWAGSSRVGEGTVAQLHDGTCVGPDSHE